MTELPVEDHEKNVAEAQAKLDEAKAKAAFQEYPKFVEVHESHIHRKDGVDSNGRPTVHISVPHFPDHHVHRETGAVTVWVKDAEEEAKALAAFVKEAV